MGMGVAETSPYIRQTQAKHTYCGIRIRRHGNVQLGSKLLVKNLARKSIFALLKKGNKLFPLKFL